jgi:hypothetical protein
MLIQFLNVDLEILSDQKLVQLERALAGNVEVLRSERAGKYWVTLVEIEPLLPDQDAEKLVFRYTELIDALNSFARSELDAAIKRTLDFGYELLDASSGSSEIGFSEAVVERAARFGCMLKTTLYANRQLDQTYP